MTQAKFMTLPDFLTDAQITEAIRLFKLHGTWDSVEPIRAQVIAPNMAAINEKLGQENDARYLACAVVHVLSQVARSPS